VARKPRQTRDAFLSPDALKAYEQRIGIKPLLLSPDPIPGWTPPATKPVERDWLILPAAKPTIPKPSQVMSNLERQQKVDADTRRRLLAHRLAVARGEG